ncbi:MAG: hypothetical protein ACR2M0_09785 [Chloroflexia bacterium]
MKLAALCAACLLLACGLLPFSGTEFGPPMLAASTWIGVLALLPRLRPRRPPPGTPACPPNPTIQVRVLIYRNDGSPIVQWCDLLPPPAPP